MTENLFATFVIESHKPTEPTSAGPDPDTFITLRHTFLDGTELVTVITRGTFSGALIGQPGQCWVAIDGDSPIKELIA